MITGLKNKVHELLESMGKHLRNIQDQVAFATGGVFCKAATKPAYELIKEGPNCWVWGPSDPKMRRVCGYMVLSDEQARSFSEDV